MAQPQWRIKTLMVLTAIVAGLLALGKWDVAGAGVAIMLVPALMPAFLEPARATNLFRRSLLALLLMWVTVGPISLGFAAIGFASRETLITVLIAVSIWLPFGFGLGCIASFWIDFLFRTKPQIWGSRDYRNGSLRRGETWTGHDGGSRR